MSANQILIIYSWRFFVYRFWTSDLVQNVIFVYPDPVK